MTREHILMILGALVLLAPWSGLPLNWLEWMLPILGLAIIGITATLRKRSQPSVPTSLPPPAPPSTPQAEEPRPRPSHIAFS